MTVMLATERTAAPAMYAAPPRAGALSLSHLTAEDAWRFCQSLAQSALLPREYRDNPGSVLWAMEYGRALGLDVVTTITTIHVINNRPTQSADLMLSRAREAGHKVRIQIGEGQCTASIWRRDDPEFENRVTWTFADAERAKLLPGKPDSNWQKYPRAMLRARAVAECVRSACPEVLHGAVYTAEELGAQVDEAGLPVASEGFQRQAPGQDAWETAAPAAAPAPLQAPAAAADAPLQQTPPDVVAAGVADIPAESLTPKGRDYLHEAMAAPDAATVRLIWQDAKAEGARPGYLAQIAEVGKGKAFIEANAPQLNAEQAQAAPEPPAAESVADTLPGDAAQAEERLRIAASRAHLTTVDRDFEQVYGLPIAQAPAGQLNAFADRIEAAGGAQ